MISHLSDKHNIGKDSDAVTESNPTSLSEVSTVTRQIQPTINQCRPKLKPEAVAVLDNAVALFIVSSELPHSIADSQPFKELLSSLSPGYTLKSRRTVKRHILEMYAVTRQLLKS